MSLDLTSAEGLVIIFSPGQDLPSLPDTSDHRPDWLPPVEIANLLLKESNNFFSGGGGYLHIFGPHLHHSSAPTKSKNNLPPGLPRTYLGEK